VNCDLLPDPAFVNTYRPFFLLDVADRLRHEWLAAIGLLPDANSCSVGAAAQPLSSRHRISGVRSRIFKRPIALKLTAEICELDEEMETRFRRRIRDRGQSGLSQNEIE